MTSEQKVSTFNLSEIYARSKALEGELMQLTKDGGSAAFLAFHHQALSSYYLTKKIQQDEKERATQDGIPDSSDDEFRHG